MDVGLLHPILVHFSIVLPTIAVILDLIGYFYPSPRFYYFSSWLYIAGALSMIPSAATGFVAAESRNESFFVFLHRTLALTLATLVWLQVWTRISFLRRKAWVPVWGYFLTSLIMIALILTGDSGGVLARGAGLLYVIPSMPDVDYNSLDNREVSSYDPEQMKKYLEEKINILDVSSIFRKYKCARCHSDYFEGGMPTNFSKKMEGLPVWLPRNEKGELVDWKDSLFYRTVVLMNRMPINSEKDSLGISWSERLVLIEWLENNAP